MNLSEFLQHELVIWDGGMGTLLQQNSLPSGEMPENWNLTHPELITRLHREYLEAGARIINANTFGANRYRFGDRLEEVVRAGLENARRALYAEDQWVALDIGPLGRMLSPLGDLDFEEAVEAFAEVVRLGDAYGADLILIETMNDAYETKAAVLAAKENSRLPVFATNVYDERGRLMTGADPKAMIALLEGLRVDGLGMNCSLGPDQMRELLPQFLEYASVPVIVTPNAGMPRVEGGVTYYGVDAEDFAARMEEMAAAGARMVGGCCGTTPDYIRRMKAALAGLTPRPVSPKPHTMISSFAHAVEFGDSPVLIGERINPTGRKRMKEALKAHDLTYLIREGLSQADQGAMVLDVNVGLPGIDEPAVMAETVHELQSVCDLPLCIDTSDPEALERAMRRYNGKPLVNSVNGKQESMDAVLPLVAHYGGVVIALTLDENGIPMDAAGRVRIAERIIAEAARYGIDARDILVDPLAMTISANTESAAITLETLRLLRQKGIRTSLGISNISFGLPQRELVTAAFFAMAMEEGLSAAIMNPASAEIMKSYYTARALRGLDANCLDYIRFAEEYVPAAGAKAKPAAAKPAVQSADGLRGAILHGLKTEAEAETRALLASVEPLDIVNQWIIPALDIVGRGFERKEIYLPQLLMPRPRPPLLASSRKSSGKAVRRRPRAKSSSPRCRAISTISARTLSAPCLRTTASR